MKIISVFNNKGGVGKSTLCFHLAHALGSLGKRVLLSRGRKIGFHGRFFLLKKEMAKQP